MAITDAEKANYEATITGLHQRLQEAGRELHAIRESRALSMLTTMEVWVEMAEDENNPAHEPAKRLIRRWKAVQQRMAAISTGIVVPRGSLNA